MAVNEVLTARVREALAGAPRVAEKRMFRGITFMVDGKMCVSVGDDRIMCRIDPARHSEAVARPGCRTVEMGGRPYIGFVYVDEKRLGPEKELRAWVEMALEYNARAKSSKETKAARPRKAGARSGAKAAKRGGRAAEKTNRPAKGAAARGGRTAKGSKAVRGAKAADRARASKAPKKRR